MLSASEQSTVFSHSIRGATVTQPESLANLGGTIDVVIDRTLAFVLLPLRCVNTESNADARLSYLDAECVRGPFHTYRDFSVWNDEDGDLGRLDGIVVDAEARQVRYLVVAAGGTFSRRRYLLPFSPARIDANRHALCVDAHKTDLVRCAKFEPRAFHRFSDDDLMNAMFGEAQ